MADAFYGVNRGQQFQDVVVAATTQTKGIEVQLKGTSGLSRGEAIQALHLIIRKINEDVAYVAAES